MKKLFFISGITFFVLVIVNATWLILNLIFISINGLQALLEGRNLIESIAFSQYLKWIILLDGLWVIIGLIYVSGRKKFKTDSKLHYLNYEPILDPKVCVIIPTYNEEKSIQSVIKDYKNQKYVEQIIVVDNNSNDNTVRFAEESGATVIKKNENRGFAHSYIMGLKEALKTNANLILTTEADGTYNAYDLQKMILYSQNVDMVIGSRYFQILTEKGNQNSILHIWGNLLMAKLIQLKYFSLHHLGIVNLTDVGCLLRLIKKSSLEKIISKLTYPNSDSPIGGSSFSLYLTMLAIENDLRIIEIPVTFKKRIGKSKTRSDEFFSAARYGMKFLWFILIS